MKKLFLLIGLVVLYSFNSFGDEYDDKLKNKYNELKKSYPSGYEIYCRWERSNQLVKWDLRKVYYIVEKKKKVFLIWNSDEAPNGGKNYRALLGSSEPDIIDYSSKDVVVWHYDDVYWSYHKKSQDLIINLDQEKNHSVNVKNQRNRILSNRGRLYDCSINYKWP